MSFRKLACLITYICYSSPALGYSPQSGYLIATETCPAYLSKNKLSNPDGAVLVESQAYALLGRNSATGNFYQIRIPGVVEELRWVHIDCGIHVVEVSAVQAASVRNKVESQAPPSESIPDNATGDPHVESPGNAAPVAGAEPEPESSNNILALSWQSAFCESRPGKPECVLLNNLELPHTTQQLSIHGLWAQPRAKIYCDVPDSIKQLDKQRRWSELPELELSESIRSELASVMPGTLSYLHRHEWVKHGTCHFSPGGADDYFADTLKVTRAINRSGVVAFLRENVGQNVKTQSIREQFDLHFGVGAGQRVQFHCEGDGDRVLLQELLINLSGVIAADTSVADLLLSADVISQGCPEGIIDAAGAQ